MSQKKVEQYKEEKKNRKQIIEKQKRRKKLWRILGPVLAVLIIAAIGTGIYYIPILTSKAAEEKSTKDPDLDELIEMLNNASVSDNDGADADSTDDGADAGNTDDGTDTGNTNDGADAGNTDDGTDAGNADGTDAKQ